MLIKGNYFAGQNRDEKILFVIRRHWIAFVPVILYFIVCFFLPIIVYLANFETFRGYPDTIFYLITLLFSLWDFIVIWSAFRAWIEFYFDVTIITSDHLIDITQTGLFHRKVSEQSFLVVQDVSSRMKGIFQTFFRYGRVFVETAGESPNFIMNNIPNPNEVADIIMNLHKQTISQNRTGNRPPEIKDKIFEDKEFTKIDKSNRQNSDQIDEEIVDYLREDQPQEPLVFDFRKEKILPNKSTKSIKEEINEGNLEEGKSVQIT